MRVDDTRPDQFYANQVVRQGHATPDEQGELEQRGSTVDAGPIFRKLYDMIDESGDKKIVSDEVRRALRKPWLAQALSHLIVEHESEWSGPMDKWDAIDELLPESRKKDWAQEKERIESLLWWRETKGNHGLPADEPLVAHNLHAIGLISIFSGEECDCTTGLTEDQLRAIAPNATRANVSNYTNEINNMFDRFGISKCVGRAHLLAQMLHESASLRYTRELGSSLSYDPWRGRGLIQITFEQNYRDYGIYIGEDVTSNQQAYEKLERTPHSVLSAGWYWSEYKNITPRGDNDDFIWCTAVVNGAYNGYEDRLAYLNRAIETLGIHSCAKKNRDGTYLFSESAVYDNRRYSFAWGLWHDPNSDKHGVTKSTERAIEGYRRYVELHDAAGRPEEPSRRNDGRRNYWYGLRVDSYRDYAENRIRSLGG